MLLKVNLDKPTIDSRKSTKCFHCGEACVKDHIRFQDKDFCCIGCQSVFEILGNHQLEDYYSLEKNPGIKIGQITHQEKYAFLDDAEIAKRYILFDNGSVCKISFSLPQIHCSSCIWLLENLNRLKEGIVYCAVNFPKRTAHITFEKNKLSLRQVAELLSSIGYGPHLNASDNKSDNKSSDKTIIYKIGIAGFCFGNLMLLALAEYFGIDESFSNFQRLFGYLSFALALPVFFYAGSDYLLGALKGIKQKFINIDIPIAMGMMALFARSSYEVFSKTGAGYFDSLAGLIFFLLIGKWFQQKTYEALSFDRDYRSYFPIAVNRIKNKISTSIPIEDLEVGDHIVLRNQELIPADSVLLNGEAYIDYSFVTGESEPVSKNNGDFLYAGGRQVGSTIQVELIKEVNNSYLTQLWNQDVFTKDENDDLNAIVNRISKNFTIIIILIALCTGLYWWLTDPTVLWRAITAVLIVACPCALALSVPFTMGNMTRIMGKLGLYLKNTGVIEKMAKLNTIVLDKTGTITRTNKMKVFFKGNPLSIEENLIINACSRNSIHPLSMAVTEFTNGSKSTLVEQYKEWPGLGLSGKINGVEVKLGSHEFIGINNINDEISSSTVYVSLDGKIRGYFILSQKYRPGLESVIKQLKRKYKVFLLSGDNDRQKEQLDKLITAKNMYFYQSPMDKFTHIKNLQEKGERVMMIGDGLNDSGALKQSDIGMAISDNVNQFSPACDAILDASQFEKINGFIKMSEGSVRIIYICFIISFLYNVVGLAFAVTGTLSPVVAAILMPVSSISVVAFTSFATRFIARSK